MSNIISLADRMRQPPPQWSAFVEITQDGAEVSTFTGADGMEVSERCISYAEKLERLAAQLRLVGVATSEDGPS